MREIKKFDQNKYIQEYKNEHYTRMTILVKKDDNIISRLKLYCRKYKTTISQVGYNAICEYLKKYDSDEQTQKE